MSSDLKIVLTSSFLRSLAISSLSVFFGLYLAALSLSETWIGLLIASGLLGMAVGTLLATRRPGRRGALIILSYLSAGGAMVLAFSSNILPLLAASFVGMVNGMGRDRGAMQAIDQAIIAQLTVPETRTASFARYTFVTDIAAAVGALIAGFPDSLYSYRIALLVYAGTLAAAATPYYFLSRRAEPPAPSVSRRFFSPESRRRVLRLAGISTMDSLGGGFITRSLLTYWFVRRFGVEPFWIGPIFAGASVVNSLAYFAAARLAKRIGLVNTMVFTHIPSSILLMLVPLAPDFPTAVGIFIVREFLAPMDVPTRQSYLAAIVSENERTAAAGLMNIVRNASWVVGPTMAGWAMALSLSAPLYIAGLLKIVYDGSLWAAFRHIKPPEEHDTAGIGRG